MNNAVLCIRKGQGMTYFGLKWNEVTYVEVLGDKITTYSKVTLKLEYLYVSWKFHFVCVCTVVVVTGFVMCECFGNMCTCSYCDLYSV